MQTKTCTVFVLGLFALACSSTESTSTDVSIDVSAVVGNRAFACNASYENVGVSKTTFKPLDFRMYVTDVVLVRADGTEVPVQLNASPWQRGKFALLDFEDGTGTCVGGTKETNTALKGTVPAGTYTGVAFTIGIPESENHLDAATAPAPLNAPGMWWSWKGGYKYMRIDVETAKNKAYYLHLGASACDGDLAKGFTCAAGNRPRVLLPKDAPLVSGVSNVQFDLAELWANVDIDAQIDPKVDFVNGCMAFPGDPECPQVFAKLGMAPDGSQGGTTQTVFRGMSK
jgi:uncharacterized repeat protein (TIGR04052 family)